MKKLVNTAALETQNDYQSKHDGIRYNQWNPNTRERWYCLNPNLSISFRGRTKTPATYKLELFLTIVKASNCCLLSQRESPILNAAGILDTPVLKARRVEQNTHIASNCSHRL